MSYQRPSEGRFYIWMGGDGLHIMHDQSLCADAVVTHDAAGRDNAKAMLRGLFDFMIAEGFEIKLRHGKVQFHRKAKP